jgi:hypothetical protein
MTHKLSPQGHFTDWELDPMIQESRAWEQHRLIRYSPEGGNDRVSSPVYRPVSTLWVDPEAPVLKEVHHQEDILFGPGVQLPEESQLQEISERVTLMDIDTTSHPATELVAEAGAEGRMEAGGQATDDGYESDVQVPVDGCAKFCSSIFKSADAPLLPRPTSPAHRGGKGRKRVMASTRSSLRLAARPSPVPVAHRAQHKLMRELQFMDSPALAPDAVITELVDLFGQELPTQAIEALKAATRMGNKKLTKILAAMAAEAGAVEMEV